MRTDRYNVTPFPSSIKLSEHALPILLVFSSLPFLHHFSSKFIRNQAHQSIEDQPVASLASRISGLTTASNDTTQPQAKPETEAAPLSIKGSDTRPKFNAGGNNLFGRALAGANRPSSSTAASSSSKTQEETSKSEPVKEEKKEDKMTMNLMDDNDGELSWPKIGSQKLIGIGWGASPAEGKTSQNGGGDGKFPPLVHCQARALGETILHPSDLSPR